MGSNKRLIAEITQGDSLIMTIDENLINVEFGALDRGSLTNVADWGIYVNRGSISFVDNKGFFNNETINSAEILGYSIIFYLAYKESTYRLATFKIKSASLNEDTKEVSVEFSSRLEELQRVKLSQGISSHDSMTAEELTESLSSNLKRDFGVNISIGDDVSGLENVNIFAPYLLKGESYWSQISKVCQASMSRLIEDKYGNPYITGEFPNRDPIIVKPYNIIDIPNSEFVRTPNLSISVADINKSYGFHVLPNAYEIPVNGGYTSEDGAYVDSLSNCDYYYLDGSNPPIVSAHISKDIESKYLILGNQEALVHEKSQVDVLVHDVSGQWGKLETKTYFSSIDVSITETGYSFPLSFSNNVIRQIRSAGASSYTGLVTNISLYDIQAEHFIIGNSTEETIITDTMYDVFNISSNELIQSRSHFGNESPPEPLSLGILNRVYGRYGEGIECFEIECLFNDYYDEQGNKVIDGENLSSHFEKYDVIIPYVKKMGETVPLRKNADGTPKKFRIIGISYYYDGLLRQKLQVQEDNQISD